MNAPAPNVIGIGHNQAPLKEMLAVSYADLAKDVAAALGSFERAPATIDDDTMLGKFGDLTRHINKLLKDADDYREAEKKPFLSAGREVDEFFKPLAGNLTDAKKSLLARSTDYLSKKEAVERASREATERQAREDADARLREAEAAQDAGDTDGALSKLAEAEVAECQAVEAQVAATAKPADLARTYSTGGSVSTLKKEWTFAVEDRAVISLDVLRPYLAPDAVDKAIRAYVKAGNRTLAGVRIYEAPKAMVR